MHTYMAKGAPDICLQHILQRLSIDIKEVMDMQHGLQQKSHSYKDHIWYNVFILNPGPLGHAFFTSHPTTLLPPRHNSGVQMK